MKNIFVPSSLKDESLDTRLGQTQDSVANLNYWDQISPNVLARHKTGFILVHNNSYRHAKGSERTIQFVTSLNPDYLLILPHLESKLAKERYGKKREDSGANY